MLWRRAGESERAVRLAYCLNLHPAEDLDGVLSGMRDITLPLRERLAPCGTFGVGLYFPASVAASLADSDVELDRLRAFLTDHGLDPFTFNAFPHGGFHTSGLKESVFRPGWMDHERLEYTRHVAEIASRLPTEASHVSISTHTGFFAGGPDEPSTEACIRNLEAAGSELERLSADRRLVLSLEPEPGANCGTTAELSEHLLPRVASPFVGTCLDACHSAVEFEEPAEALFQATSHGAPLGKLQFTSALSLSAPGRNPRSVERLLSMDEPRYLHQVRGLRVRGRVPGERWRAADLPELGAVLELGDSRWLEADEWRCHFHVPVDLESIEDGEGGLSTTREHAGGLLAQLLENPGSWGTRELHVEIETYTWDVLPGPARGPGDLVDGLEREYRHVAELLVSAGYESV